MRIRANPKSIKSASTSCLSNLRWKWRKGVQEGSQTSEHIAGITRKEGQKDRPARTPEGGAQDVQKKERKAFSSKREWKAERSNVLLAVLGERGSARRETLPRVNDGARDRGGSTHKTEKHVISPRRGEKARPREISRRLVLLLHPPLPTSLSCQHPFLTLPFLSPSRSSFLTSYKASEQHGAFYLFE